MPSTFTKIVVITRNKDEPLYNYLKEQIPECEIFEGLNNIPDLDKDFKKDVNNLVIFDDLVMEKNQRKIEEYSIRCRKMGISMCYLTQNWFATPNTIRKNINYLILKKIPKQDDLNRVMRDYSLGIDKETMLSLYKYATKGEDSTDKTNFFLIDLNEDDDSELKFRRNFKGIKFAYESD